MNRLVTITLTAVLAASYGWLAVAVTKPKVSTEYKAYYIDGKTVYWKPERYNATAEQGIDFRKPGLPTFVRYVSGVSYGEGWGRWSDQKAGDGVRIEYNTKFAHQACVKLTAQPSPSQRGRNVDIILGPGKATIRTDKPSKTTYVTPISLSWPTSELLLKPESPGPVEWDPNGKRARRLGLAIESIAIIPGACKAESNTSRIEGHSPDVRDTIR